jgi:hypothetical protein
MKQILGHRICLYYYDLFPFVFLHLHLDLEFTFHNSYATLELVVCYQTFYNNSAECLPIRSKIFRECSYLSTVTCVWTTKDDNDN